MKLRKTLAIVCVLLLASIGFTGCFGKSETYIVNVQSESSLQGTVSKSPIKDVYDKGEKITLTATPKQSFVFAGWFDTQDVSVSKENPYTFKVSKNETYKAKFINSEYTFSFNLDGGKTADGSTTIASIKKIFGEKIALPTITKQGYDFLGWKTNLSESIYTDTFTVPTNLTTDVEFVAKYKKNLFTFSYNLDNGITLDNKTSIDPVLNKTFGDEIALPKLTKVDYIFLGWKTNLSQSIIFEESFIVPNNLTDDIEFVAQYKKIAFIFTFNLKGGITVEGGETQIPSTDKTTFGDIVALPTLIKKGYTFAGWKLGKTGVVITSDEFIVPENTVDGSEFIAQFNAKVYKPKLVIEGSDKDLNASGEYIITYGQPLNNSLPVSDKETERWDWKYNGVAVDFTTNFILDNDNINEKEIVFTAKVITMKVFSFKISDSTTITFRIATGDTTVKTIAEIDGIKGLNFDKVGYEFIGWVKESPTEGDENISITSISFDSDNTKAYIPNYKLKTYTVETNDINGKGTITFDNANKIYEYNSEVSMTITTGNIGTSARKYNVTKITYKIAGDETDYEIAVLTENNGNGVYKIANMPAGNVKFTVDFKAQYGISLNTQMSNLKFDEKVIENGGKVSLEIPNKNLYDFAGWFSAKEGGIKLAHVNGEMVDNFWTIVETEELMDLEFKVNLYAQYIQNKSTFSVGFQYDDRVNAPRIFTDHETIFDSGYFKIKSGDSLFDFINYAQNETDKVNHLTFANDNLNAIFNVNNDKPIVSATTAFKVWTYKTIDGKAVYGFYNVLVQITLNLNGEQIASNVSGNLTKDMLKNIKGNGYSLSCMFTWGK